MLLESTGQRPRMLLNSLRYIGYWHKVENYPMQNVSYPKGQERKKEKKERERKVQDRKSHPKRN